MQAKGRLGILIVGLFAAIAGIGEIVVGFTGNYLGILSHPIAPSMATAIIGALYSLGGLFILTMRKWGAAIGFSSSAPKCSDAFISWRRALPRRVDPTR